MNKAIYFSILILFSIGCSNSNSGETLPKHPNQDGYIFLKYGFYKNERGNLFEKKYIAIDQTHPTERYYYDSTMFVGDYPNQSSLQSIIDIESFHEFEHTPFSADKNHVYYIQATSDGHQRFIVKGADPTSFSPIMYRYGRDNQNVYWETEPIEGADLMTFEVDTITKEKAHDKFRSYSEGKEL